MELKTHLSPFPNPRKRNLKELVSSDLEEIAGTGSLPKRKKTFLKDEPVSDPKELGNKRVPREERTGGGTIACQEGATQQRTQGGYCQQKQWLQEKEKVSKALLGKSEWTSP